MAGTENFDGIERKEIWYSGDGMKWNRASNNPPWPYVNRLTTFVFQNKLWTAGGEFEDEDWNLHLNRNLFYSVDGQIWQQGLPFSGLRFSSTASIFKNRIFFTGGAVTSTDSDGYLYLED